MDYTSEEVHRMSRLAHETLDKIHKEDKSGRLLYLFCVKLCAISKLRAYDITRDDKYRFVVLTKDEYEKLKSNN